MDLSTNFDVDYFIAGRALDQLSGDAALVDVTQEQMFVGVIDGAGHGSRAHTVSQTARTFLEENKNKNLPVLMQALHEELRGTRGGVAIIGKLDVTQLQLTYVGAGNITLRKFGIVSKREKMQGGIIGYQLRTPIERVLQLVHGDVIVMHSDGISSQFDIDDYPQILKHDARTIARNLIEKFAKNEDDAICLVIRV
jgi:phosphoserine phosphatase RsbX|tara:strand:+ start:814 stop:1401 length:588 start_codon:yes stop_codon:yes gene_type:complete